MHLPVLAITDRQPTCNPLLNHLEFAMNIELDEVVVQDVSDDALEMAAGGWIAYAQVSWLNLQTHCVA